MLTFTGGTKDTHHLMIESFVLRGDIDASSLRTAFDATGMAGGQPFGGQYGPRPAASLSVAGLMM